MKEFVPYTPYQMDRAVKLVKAIRAVDALHSFTDAEVISITPEGCKKEKFDYEQLLFGSERVVYSLYCDLEQTGEVGKLAAQEILKGDNERNTTK